MVPLAYVYSLRFKKPKTNITVYLQAKKPFELPWLLHSLNCGAVW